MDIKHEISGLRQDLSHRHELARIRQRDKDANVTFDWISIAGLAAWMTFIIIVVR